MRRKIVIIALSMLFSISSIQAQDCGQKLSDATRAYYNGDLRQVEPLLINCLSDKQLDNYQKTEALKLLTNTYLVLREDSKADRYMNQLLTHDPELIARSSDIIEFRKLHETYRIQTRFNFGLIAGFNLPDYQVMRYQSYASETLEPSDYNEKAGLSLGISGDFHLWKNIFLRGSLMYMSSGFRQEEIILRYQRVATEETEQRINFPVELYYIYDHWKFKPFLGGGFAMHYLLSSKANIDHAPIVPEIPSGSLGIPQTVRDYDLTDQREKITWNWVMSAGVQRKINKLTLEARVSYEYGLNNLVKTEARFSDQELLDKYAYVPDDYKMDNIRFTIGVFRTLSKPVKK